METYRAIPDGYMTVGEAAKKMGVTVRALQYYDQKGLLKPSAESGGGRRLYTDKDLIKLHQILSLKSLGFSLEDIKERLVSLETPAEVAQALADQEQGIRKEIGYLSEVLRMLTQLREEVLQMQQVDFKKYADIIVNLQMKNEFYFLIKEFDEEILDHIRGHFDKESGLEFIDRFQRLCDQILELQKAGTSPESDKCQRLTKEYWDMILEFTAGDMSLLPKLAELGNFESVGGAWKEKQALVNAYMEPALAIYFSKLGGNPFEEGRT